MDGYISRLSYQTISELGGLTPVVPTAILLRMPIHFLKASLITSGCNLIHYLRVLRVHGTI